jgi:RHS repeat-associated protein
MADPPPPGAPTSISLASDKSTFTAGQSFTLTATVDVDVSASASVISIVDQSSGATLRSCSSGTSCAVSASFYTGGPRTYVATVNALTSNQVSVARAAWSVTLSVDSPVFAAGQSVTMTATANQNTNLTGNGYGIYLFNQSTGALVRACLPQNGGGGASCVMSWVPFYTGGPYDYVAVVAKADTGLSEYGQLADAQASSNVVTVSRQAWSLALTVDNPVFSAGQSVTLTATANQTTTRTSSNYGIYLFNKSTGALYRACLPANGDGGYSCAMTGVPFYTGGPYDFVAVVAKADANLTTYAQLADVQASSNLVTLTRQTWTLTLSADATTFAAGQSVTLTATSNQSTTRTGSNYGIYLFNKTTGALYRACLPQNNEGGYSCSITSVPFYTGGPYDYVAVVAKADTSLTQYSQLVDVQASSNVVTLTRQAWTVTLSADTTTFIAGHVVDMTAAANQYTSRTSNNYGIYLFDQSTGALYASCLPQNGNGGASCFSERVPFYTGAPHQYVAVVAKADPSLTQYSQLVDIQASSNVVTLTRAAWAVSLTPWDALIGSNGEYLDWTATSNQNVGNTGGYYKLLIVDYTAGRVIENLDNGISQPVEQYFTWTQTPHALAALVAQYDPATGAYWDVQAVSNTVTGPIGGGPMLPGEAAGGSNAAENGCQACRQDPIDTATGAFTETITDLGLPGVGPALTVTRSYDSSTATGDGPLGYGWSLNLAAHLSLTAGDGGDPLPRTVTVTQENGATVLFTEDATGHYVPPARVMATLSHDPGNGQWNFVRHATDTMVFNAAGTLQTISDLHGTTVTLHYDPTSGQLATATGSGGRSLTFGWTGAHLTGVADSAGRSVAYGYDTAGNLTSVTAADQTVTGYGYDPGHLLSTITSPSGAQTHNSYDSAGRVASQTDPDGRVTSFSYGGTAPSLTTTMTAPGGAVTIDTYNRGQLISSTAAAGTSAAATWNYAYDAASNPASVTDPAGAKTSYSYDARGNPLNVTDPLNHTTSYTYDELNDLTSTTDALHRTWAATYNNTGDRLTLTPPAGSGSSWTYNSDGTVHTATDANQHTTAYTYTDTGLPHTITGADQRTTTYHHDVAGRIDKITNNAQQATDYHYDDAGRLLTVTDANTHATSYTYYPDGQLASVTDPNTHTTHYDYYPAGELKTVTDPLGDHSDYSYDAAGHLQTVTDPDGHTTSYGYDPRGNLTSSTDPDQRTTHYLYDGDERLLSTTSPAGAVTSTSYDPAGRITATTDANGHQTSYGYDNANELTSSTDPLGRITTRNYTDNGQLDTITLPDSTSTIYYGYDPAGQLTDYTDPDGQHTSYSYDNAGRPTQQVLPGELTTHYDYDTAGRLQTTTLPDTSTITRGYDPAGQLTSLDYSNPNTADVSYGYDDAGQRISMTDGTGTTRYHYDQADRLTSTTNGHGDTVGYDYYPSGLLKTLTYPDTSTVAYTYDNAGQMTNATTGGDTTSFDWTADGQLHTQTNPNAVTASFDYKPAGQPASITIRHNSDTLASYGYGYDNAEQLTSDTTTDPIGATSNTYSYTDTSQLHTVTSGDPATTLSYTTTPGGQLTALTDGTSLGYNSAGQLTTRTPSTGPATNYGYDNNGNRTSATTTDSPALTTSYNYDQTGALTQVTQPGGASITYTSDGDGLRQTRTSSTGTSHYTWGSINGSLPLLLDDGTHHYLYGPDQTPYAQIDNTTGTTDYLHTDALGSVRLITDSSGTVTGTTRYDPYGNRTTHTGATDSTLGYTGNLTDPDTGLLYLRARDYDPTTGQFLTVDPAITTTHQPYAYAGNNPLQNTDPSGLCWLSDKICDGLKATGSTTLGVLDTATGGVSTKLFAHFFPGAACELTHNNFFKAGQWAPLLLGGTALLTKGLTILGGEAADGLATRLAARAQTAISGLLTDDTGAIQIGRAAEDSGVTFHTVQGAEDAARLRAGGTPWPTGASRSSLGQGVYSFGSRVEAEGYAAHLAGRGASDLQVMSFTVASRDLASFRSLDIDSLADPEAFLSKYSQLWGGTPNHGYEYLTRGTQFGTEHFFDSSVFGRLNFGG